MGNKLKRWAVIRDDTIINICLWDGVTPWTPGPGTQLLKDTANKLGVGMKKDQNGHWYMPAPAPIEYETTPSTCETCGQLYFKPKSIATKP